MGDFGMVCDTAMNFHYAVWPQFTYEGNTEDENWNYVMTYIGNDNYEPLGAANALHPSDPYVVESYTGRFFTDYYNNGTFEFADPDTTYIADGTLTLRQAYEAYDLPFWFLKFDVKLNVDGEPMCDVYINNFKLFTAKMFYDYDVVNKPQISMSKMQLHVVNYGIDADGTPDDWYVGRFTYPRLIVA